MSKPRITPAGLGLFWVSLGAVTVGAIRFDGMLLLLGAIGAGALALARFLAPRNLRGIRIRREMPEHVFAGEPFEISYFLSRDPRSRIGAYAISMRDNILPHGPAGILWADRIPPGGETTSGIVRTRLFRRGLEKRCRFELTSTFPLGLFETRGKGQYESPENPKARRAGILVYPKPLLPRSLRRQLDLERFEIAHQQGADPEPGGDFRGVRLWRPGDPLRTIHWPATARMGALTQNPEDSSFATLMVRDWDPPGPKPRRYGILFHSYSRAGKLLRPDRFEAALQVVAGLLVFCRNEEIPIRLTLLAGDSGSGTGANLSIPDRCRFSEALARLAIAKRVPCLKRRSLSNALGAFANCDSIFAISDTPIDSWRRAVQQGRSVVCVDSETVRLEPPRLRLKPNPADTGNQ